MQRVEKVLERVSELPFSPVAAKILEMAQDERVGARDIAKIIAQDQAFTARLLKIANSPYYGQTRAVTTVTQAVPVLGINTITSLALALFSFGSLAQDDNEILSLRELWEHSLGCAFWGRQIAKRIGLANPEESFIAGLLHDMGKALFYRFFKKEFLTAVSKAQNEAISLTEAERIVLGTDHASAGLVVASKWHLPFVLLQSIGWHHDPLSLHEDTDESVRRTVAIVHVADMLSEFFEIGRGIESDPEVIGEEIWDFLGLRREICDELLDAVLSDVAEFRRIFNLVPDAPKPTARAGLARNGVDRSEKVTMGPWLGTDKATAPVAAIPNSLMENFARFMEAGKRLALLAGLDELLPNIATQAMMLLKADAAEVLVAEDDALKVVASAGLTQLLNQRIPTDGSLVGWVAKMGETMVVPHIEKAPASWEKDFFARVGFHAHLFLPVEWAGKRLAVLAVHDRKERPWTSQDVALFNPFVGLVAVALENARLYREAEEKASALAELNRRLKEALYLKTRFLATVSHELRSPLFVITGYANLIVDDTFGKPSPGMLGAMEKIIAQADGLLALITNILDISQMERGALTVDPAPLDLQPVLEEVARAVGDRVAGTPVHFEACIVSDLPEIISDGERLKQILRNVLDNAVKFTEQGKIVLRAAPVGEHIEITVEDTGVGISAEDQNIIFDGFRQVENYDSRRYEGLGVGLHITRRLLELLGGRIEVESQVGRGSTFRIWIPKGELISLPADLPPGGQF